MSISLVYRAIGLAVAFTIVPRIAQAGDRDVSEAARTGGAPVVIKVEVSENTDSADHRRRNLALAMLQMAHDDALSLGDARSRTGLAQMIGGMEAKVRRSASRLKRTVGSREIHVVLPANCLARGGPRETKSADLGGGVATLAVRRAGPPSPLSTVFLP